jgi:NTP pyrophosphatase (non-canonical NTP hydrolase)
MFRAYDDKRICFMDCGIDYCVCKQRQHLQGTIESVFSQPEPKERKVVAYTGCSTYGMIEYDRFCGDPHCKNCKERSENIIKIFQEEIIKQNKMIEIFDKIQNECDRQDQKWGIRNMHPASWFLILNEEIGESAQEVNDAGHETDKINLEQYEMELVQSAAVIVQMIKNIQHYKNER